MTADNGRCRPGLVGAGSLSHRAKGLPVEPFQHGRAEPWWPPRGAHDWKYGIRGLCGARRRRWHGRAGKAGRRGNHSRAGTIGNCNRLRAAERITMGSIIMGPHHHWGLRQYELQRHGGYSNMWWDPSEKRRPETVCHRFSSTSSGWEDLHSRVSNDSTPQACIGPRGMQHAQAPRSQRVKQAGGRRCVPYKECGAALPYKEGGAACHARKVSYFPGKERVYACDAAKPRRRR